MNGRPPGEELDPSTDRREPIGVPCPEHRSDGSLKDAKHPIPFATRLRQRGEIIAAFALTLLWLWLISSRVRTAIGPAPHDDYLFIDLARSIVSGHWLGRYSNMVLAKGPFYPLWIATCFGLNIPLQFAEALLYAGACVAVVAALEPILRHPLPRMTLFALLLFSPAAIGGPTRVVRECVYPALTLLVFAGAIALVLRAHQPWRATRRWAMLLGIALGLFFLCREERIWIAPALLLLTAYALARRASLRNSLITGLVALIAFFVPVGIVMAINLSLYGVAAITEFTEGPFPDAYAALGRVRHATFRLRVPLPAETRQRIYAASPHFAELAFHLETDALAGWRENSCRWLHICDEMGAGFIMWALRDAAALAGHYRTGRDAASYWRAVTEEVDQACNDGRLACHRSTGSFLPPWKAEYAALFLPTFVRTVSYFIRFQDLTADTDPSIGTAEELARFQDLTRDRLAPTADARTPPLEKQAALDRRRLVLLRDILVAYRALVPVAAAVALMAWLAAGVAAISRRRIGATLIISSSVFLALAARAAIVAAIDVTAFPVVNALYLAPAYPLLIAFVVIAPSGVPGLIKGQPKVFAMALKD